MRHRENTMLFKKINQLSFHQRTDLNRLLLTIFK